MLELKVILTFFIRDAIEESVIPFKVVKYLCVCRLKSRLFVNLQCVLKTKAKRALDSKIRLQVSKEFNDQVANPL